MRDYLGNDIQLDDMVIFPRKQGRYAMLAGGYVRDMEQRRQFKDGQMVPMVKIEYSNVHEYWYPASKIVRIPEDMIPEIRREKLNATAEAIIPS